MPIYRVTLIYSASKTIEVEADSPEDALQAGYDRGYVSLCHQCTRNIELGDACAAEVCDEHGEIVLKDG